MLPPGVGEPAGNRVEAGHFRHRVLAAVVRPGSPVRGAARPACPNQSEELAAPEHPVTRGLQKTPAPRSWHPGGSMCGPSGGWTHSGTAGALRLAHAGSCGATCAGDGIRRAIRAATGKGRRAPRDGPGGSARRIRSSCVQAFHALELPQGSVKADPKLLSMLLPRWQAGLR
jgi:hypothetical protein